MATAVAILVALTAPYAFAAMPRCAAAEERPCDPAPDRCAGLWSAECCDFSAPRARVAEELDTPPELAGTCSTPPAEPPAPLAATVAYNSLSPPGGPPPDLQPDTGISSTVLRL